MNQDKIQKQQAESIIKQFKYSLGKDDQFITISSNFDSGNIVVTRQISDFQYRLECLNDGVETKYPTHSKSWFYFQVSGFPKNTKGKFIVSKLQALSSIYYSKYAKCYRPVFRINRCKWLRFQSQVPLNLRQNGQIQCTIEHIFTNPSEKVQFAFCYPYSFETNQIYLNNLNNFHNHPDFYFHQEVIIESPEKRPIHLLTITSYDQQDKQKQHEDLFNQNLFPLKQRPLKFKKPVVLITARVHPGETPSSYAMEGVINFLTNTADLRSHLLRKMFVFMIVPMINVDGVVHGHFRMDKFGKNLNRFYINPKLAKEPAVYAIKSLANHLITQNRLSFYFDLHAHNAKKGSFIYGNAIGDFVEQVQSQVYCKLFGMNHLGFQYQSCNFTQKHMNAKDRFEDLTKQGCGRVVMYKAANIIHSYSVQCGIISSNNCNQLPQPTNIDFKIDGKSFTVDDEENSCFERQKTSDNSPLFTQDTYRNLGKNLLVSILDVFDKNPYNRVYNSRYKSMEMLRRVTAFEIFHSADRFRMFERYVFGKVKNINNLIQEVLNTKLHYQKLYNFYFNEESDIKEIEWPKNIIGLQKQVNNGLNKSKTKMKLFQGKLPIVQIESEFSQTKNELSKIHQTIDQYHNISQPFKSYEQVQKSQKSSDSGVENEELNQEIFMMCENEKEQNEVFGKILRNDFNEQDFEEIEQKYKNKVTPSKSMHHQEIIFNCDEKSTPKKQIRQYSSTKEHKYKITKKLLTINQKDISINRIKAKNSLNVSKQKLQIDEQFPNLNLNELMPERETKKMSAAEQFRKNIYDAIKNEIRQGLKRQHQKKKIFEKNNKTKIFDSYRHNTRISAPNYTDFKHNKSKVRLPSLGSGMYIITTSTRAIKRL